MRWRRAQRAQHHLLVIAHFPAPKRHGVLRHNSQLEQKGKTGQTRELVCLLLSAPPTNILSVYFISLKVGGGPAQAVGLAAVEGVLCLLLAEGGGGLDIKSTAVTVAVALDVNVVNVTMDATTVVAVVLVDGRCSGHVRGYGGERTGPHSRLVAAVVMVVVVMVDTGINCLGCGQSGGSGRDGGHVLAMTVAVVDTVAAATTIAVADRGCSRCHVHGCDHGSG